jgi:hypothetical protein
MLLFAAFVFLLVIVGLVYGLVVLAIEGIMSLGVLALLAVCRVFGAFSDHERFHHG